MAKRKDSRSAVDTSASVKVDAATPEISIMAPAVAESADAAVSDIKANDPITLSDAPTLAPTLTPTVAPTVADMMIGPRMPDGYAARAAAAKAAPAVDTLSKIAREIAATPPMQSASSKSEAKVSAPSAPAPSYSFLRLAATVAIAAGLGAVLGAGGVSAFGKLTAPLPVHTVEANPSKTAKLEGEIVALKASLEAATKNTSGQFGKMAERLERAEKSQAEPAAKVAKLSDKINDALERFDQRLAVASAPETTGSISPTRSIAPTEVKKQEKAQEKLQDKLQGAAAQPVIPGWVLRDIFDGRALVESQFGMFEVAPGGNLPGLGRVATIKRQDGRWVVVTPKGVIVSERM